MDKNDTSLAMLEKEMFVSAVAGCSCPYSPAWFAGQHRLLCWGMGGQCQQGGCVPGSWCPGQDESTRSPSRDGEGAWDWASEMSRRDQGPLEGTCWFLSVCATLSASIYLP